METLLFLIVIGILSTIFGKGKGKNNRTFQNSKPFTANTFGDIKKFFQTELPKEIQTEFKEVVNKENIQEEYQKVNREITDSQSKWASSQQLERPSSRMSASAPEKVEEEQPILSEKPDSNTIINGIIWAEILGEPRSRKPYFSNKR